MLGEVTVIGGGISFPKQNETVFFKKKEEKKLFVLLIVYVTLGFYICWTWGGVLVCLCVLPVCFH